MSSWDTILSPHGENAGEPPLAELRVVVGNAWEVVVDALRLRSCGLEVVEQYLNPGTIFFVCYAGEHVVGATSWIPDGPYGLPADRFHRPAMDDLRSTGRVTENGVVVVADASRALTRDVALRMFAAGACRVGDLDILAARVALRDQPFYADIAGFVPLGGVTSSPLMSLSASRFGDARRTPGHPYQRRLAELSVGWPKWLETRIDSGVQMRYRIGELLAAHELGGSKNTVAS